MTSKSGSRVRQALRGFKPLYQALGLARYARLLASAGYHRVKDGLTPADAGGLPVPPPMLRYRVHGQVDRASFLGVGRQCAADIRGILESAGRPLQSHAEILDFGCGCGRVLRHFLAGSGAARFHGTDIDPRGVQWCARHLKAAQWHVNPFLPPTGFATGQFSLAYAISVFTHLDEEYQHKWLAELKRIVKPGGTLLLTVHGRPVYGDLPEEDQRLLAEKGILFKVGRTGRLKLDGLPDFYQGAYHTREYIDKEWSRYFRILGYYERGINGHQDAVVLSNG